MNRVELIGRLARDAELKVLPSGTSISKFTIATDKFTKGEEKSVMDGLTGAAFIDDSQVCDCHTVKRYGVKPGVFIQMEEME